MMTLRIAAIVSAAVTVILNATHGYKASATIEFAIMLATLQAALDIAKCALIPASVRIWRQKHHLLSFLALALFALLFLNSVWNALSQVVLTRDVGKAVAVGQAQNRARAEATYKRLTTELALQQANPNYTATAACTAAKTKDGRSFCDTLAKTKRDLATAEASLAKTSPADPDAPVTLLATLTGHAVPTLTLTLAVIPVLLAELVGSLGFLFASAGSHEHDQKPRRTLWERFLARCLGWWRAIFKMQPNPRSGSPAPLPPPPIPPGGAVPVIAWPGTRQPDRRA